MSEFLFPTDFTDRKFIVLDQTDDTRVELFTIRVIINNNVHVNRPNVGRMADGKLLLKNNM